jgi:hypothetical protein
VQFQQSSETLLTTYLPLNQGSPNTNFKKESVSFFQLIYWKIQKFQRQHPLETKALPYPFRKSSAVCQVRPTPAAVPSPGFLAWLFLSFQPSAGG